MGSAVLCYTGCIQCLSVRMVTSTTQNRPKLFKSYELPRISRVQMHREFICKPDLSKFHRNKRKSVNSSVHRLSASLDNEVAFQETDIDTSKDSGIGDVADDSPKEEKVAETSAFESAQAISVDSSSNTKQIKTTGGSQRKTNPQVKDEELIPGAIFTGKVTSIQPYGAFVEFGASLEGLVHISRLSRDFVKNVKDFVSIGQDVTVKIVEANLETGRIALSMLLDKDADKEKQKKASEPNSVRETNAKGTQVHSKFRKGQVLEGKVKGFIRSGALIELPDNEEGYLPTSEVSDEYTSLNKDMGLTRSQKVKVEVTRVDRGRVRLTMKLKEKENPVLEDEELEAASNPFELAFRNHPVISAYLKEKESSIPENSLAEGEKQSHGNDIKTSVMDIAVDDVGEPSNHDRSLNSTSKNTQEILKNGSLEMEGTGLQTSESKLQSSDALPDGTNNTLSSEKEVVNGSYEDLNDNPNNKGKENATSSVSAMASDVNSSSDSANISGCVSHQPGHQEVKAGTNLEAFTSTISASLVKQLRDETGVGMMDCKKALAETAGDLERARDLLRKKGLASAEKKASRVAAEGRIGSYIHDSRIGVLLEVNCETDFVSRGDIFKELVEDLSMQIAACPQVQYVSAEDVPEDVVQKEREIELQKEDLLSKPEQIREKIVDGRIRKIVNELALLEQPYIKNDKLTVKDLVTQSIATLGENIQVRRFTRYNLGEGLEKKDQDFAAEVAAQTTVAPSVSPPLENREKSESSSTVGDEAMTQQARENVAISAALVRQLREESGAGMMDCKKALVETQGDIVTAQEVLRKKGLASADKKSGRMAAEGKVGSYVHDNRIGVLIEVNCETDFVSRGDAFKQLVEDLAMQVVACPQVQYVSIEEIPKTLAEKEREIEMLREDILSKPEQIREKIVEGRLSKRLGELALLEQPFLRDDKMLVKDVVKQVIASLGENIRVRRFVRYNLGEGVEKKSKDLSAEIAEQTKARASA
eukprot:TRINITY_DN170_c0_g1_i3.p1 TRINITY_DN170_c0_g1~~TRINITY_DN170_c0_g1_i3.p1  ORF type:complete len:989 (+),score=285.62 TRINITY_DN170_c0_g1_i3:301-3267(+)